MTVKTATESTTESTVHTPAPRPGSASRSGVMAMLPLIAGYVPFALVVGGAIGARGDVIAGWAGSWLIYGGSAQLATVRSLDDSGLLIAVATGLLINARLVVYSASLSQIWRDQPRWFRFAAAGLIIDPTWAAAERHAQHSDDPTDRRRFFVAAGLTLGVGWSMAIALGIVVGARLDGIDTDIVVPLCLLAMVGGGLTDRRTCSVIVTSAAVAVVASGWPAGTSVLVATAAGCGVGVLGDRTSVSRP